MSEIQIKTQIEKLQNLASNGIDSKELDEAKSILEVIKSEKASKSQLEEIIKLLDREVKNFPAGNFVAVNTLNSQKEDFEKLLSNYSEEKQTIIDGSFDSAQEVKGTLVKASEVNNDSQKKYNEKHIETYSQRINTVLGKLDENNETQKGIKEALGNTLISSSDIRVRNLQDLLISSGAHISTSGNADGFFGRKTMAALEKIVGIETVDTTKSNPTHKKGTALHAAAIDNKTVNKTPTEQKTPEIKYGDILGYTKNGANYIIGPKGKAELITFSTLSPEYKKELEKHKDILLKVENFKLIAEAYKQNGNLNYGKGLNERLVNINIKNLDNLETYMQANAPGINLTNKSQVLSFIRDKLGNSNFALNELSNDLLQKNTGLTNDDINKFINNPNQNNTKIQKILAGDYSNFVNNTIEKKAEAEKYFNEYKGNLKKQYPTLSEETLQKITINSFLNGFTKTKILEKVFKKYKNIDKNKTPEAYLFSDITGCGSLGDSSINLSDKTISWGKEAFIFVGTEALALAAGALTMGIGEAAVNAAVYGTRAVKLAKYADKSFEGLNYLEKTSLGATKLARYGAMSSMEGGSFYAGYAGAQSGIEGKNMFSVQGLGESIAFAGAFRGLNGLYKAFGKEIKYNPDGSLLAGQKLKITSQMLTEGTAFAALGLGFDGKLLEPGEWTAETILQAFMMAAIFKGAGIKMDKVKIRKNGDNIEVVKQESAVKTEILEGEIFARKGVEYISTEKGVFTKNGKLHNTLTDSFIKNPENGYEKIGKGRVKVEVKEATGGKETKKTESTEQKSKTSESNSQSSEKTSSEKGTKATEETINTEARASEEILDNAGNISKFAKGKFTDLFKKELKENESITVGEKTYKKRADGKFEIEGDDILYSEKQILDKIKDEDKIVFLQSRAKQNIANLGEESIKLKDGFFDFLGKYKVSKNEVLIKENGTWRKITNENELNKFYADNFEELLKKTKGIDVNKIAENTSKSFLSKFDGSKGSDALKAFDKWAEQAFLLKYGYKPGRWITKTALHEMATPYNILKGIKDAKGFGETVKSIIFADKDMGIVKGTLKVGAYAIVPAAGEVIRKTNNGEPINLNGKDVIEDYLEFMYLGIINGLIIEYVERKINKPENETKN